MRGWVRRKLRRWWGCNFRLLATCACCLLAFFVPAYLFMFSTGGGATHDSEAIQAHHKLEALKREDPLIRAAIWKMQRGDTGEREFRDSFRQEQHVSEEEDDVSCLNKQQVIPAIEKEIRRLRLSSAQLHQYISDCGLLDDQRLMSAIKRSTSGICRVRMAVTICLQKQGKLYPASVPDLCPAADANLVPRPDDGSPVRIVFLLQVSGRSERQVERLLKAIYSHDHYYLFHVDAGSSFMFSFVSRLTAGIPNAHVLCERYDTIWGGSDLLRMHLFAMRQASVLFGDQFDFFINLSESDYPLWPVGKLAEYLGQKRGVNFVFANFRVNETYFVEKQGISRTFLQCNKHMWLLSDRPLPGDVHFTGSSDWFVLSREFTQYVSNPRQDKLLSSLIAFYAFTLLPSESFFATLIRRSEFCHRFENNDLRFVNWNGKAGCSCIEKRYAVDWCGCSPNVIMPSLVPAITKQVSDPSKRPMAFARKFDAAISVSAINRLEETVANSSSDHDCSGCHWLNFYHHLDTSTATPIVQSIIPHVESISHQLLGDNEDNCGWDRLWIRRIEHHFDHDRYEGDVVSLGDERNTLAQVLLKPKRGFKSSSSHVINAEVSRSFDTKENITRWFNHWLHSDDRQLYVHLEVDPTDLGQWKQYKLCITDEDSGQVVWDLMANVTHRHFHASATLSLPPASYVLHVASASEQLAVFHFFVIGSSPGSVTDFRLVQSFWQAAAACSLASDGLCQLASCHQQKWSSFYPDPKTAFTQTRVFL